jgi:hypothetical protein
VTPESATRLGQRARARLAFGEAAREASDYARALVPTGGEEHMKPGEFIIQARRLRVHQLRAACWAVILELASGTTWTDVAAACHMPEDDVRDRYEDAWEAFLAGSDAPWDGTEMGLLPPLPLSPLEAAKPLDEWCVQHMDPDDRVSNGAARPVSDNLF